MVCEPESIGEHLLRKDLPTGSAFCKDSFNHFAYIHSGHFLEVTVSENHWLKAAALKHVGLIMKCTFAA